MIMKHKQLTFIMILLSTLFILLFSFQFPFSLWIKLALFLLLLFAFIFFPLIAHICFSLLENDLYFLTCQRDAPLSNHTLPKTRAYSRERPEHSRRILIRQIKIENLTLCSRWPLWLKEASFCAFLWLKQNAVLISVNLCLTDPKPAIPAKHFRISWSVSRVWIPQ